MIVRYGEITLKSPYVREFMEKELVKTIKYKLKRNKVNVVGIRKIPGRIFIYVDSSEKAVNVALNVSKIFGVVSTSPAVEIERNSLEYLRKFVLKYSSDVLEKGDTFAVRVRRVKKYPITSKELERILGADILNTLQQLDLRVNLSNPLKTIHVEVRTKKAYIYHETVKGVGGLPYGVSGKVVALISGGIDSPVAAWLIMKRGVKVVPIFFDLGNFTTEETIEKALKAIKKIREWAPSPEFYFYKIPFNTVLEAITKNVPAQFTCIFCKILMFKIAERIAEKEEAKALVTGESLGQVASQTLDNLCVVSKMVSIPILRPLIGLDKEEIISIAKNIGTYEITAKSIIECKASPVFRGSHAAARTRNEIIDKYKDKIHFEELIMKSLEEAMKINLP